MHKSTKFCISYSNAMFMMPTLGICIFLLSHIIFTKILSTLTIKSILYIKFWTYGMYTNKICNSIWLYIGYMLSHVHKTVSPEINNWKFPWICFCFSFKGYSNRYSRPPAWINTSHFEVDFLWAFIWLNYAHPNTYFAINYSPAL